MRNAAEKSQFVIDWLERGPVDILNSEFVDSYIERFKPRHAIMTFGANRCPELSRLLSSMWTLSIIDRQAVGLSDGSWQPGFPKWVWSYSKKNKV